MADKNYSGGQEIISERKKRILSLRSLLFLLFSVFCIWMLLSQIDIPRTMAAFASVRVEYVGLCLLLYCVSTFFKAVRFNIILKSTGITLAEQWAVSSYHNFFNMVFPARTGELTFIYYANRIAKVPFSNGLHALLATRFLDLVIVAGVFIVTFFVHFGSSVSVVMVAAAVSLALASLAALFCMPAFLRISVRLFDMVCKILRLDRIAFIEKAGGKLREAVHDFENYSTMRDILPLAFTSLMTWLALYTMFYFSILAFGIGIPYNDGLLGSTGAVLTNVLPINSFGSFGTLEAGWTGGFMMVGMSLQDAVTTGFGSHLINFFSSIVLSVGTFVWRKIFTRT